MQIFVKSITGKTILLNIKPSETIDHVKSLIEKREGIPKEHQRLISGKNLQNYKTISDYNIKNLSTIYMSLRLRSSMPIIIKTLSTKTILNVNPFDTISNIKKLIEDNKGIQSENQRLLFNGKSLKNEKTLNDYNINRLSIIHLVYNPLKNNRIMKISITNIVGKKIFISVKPSNIIKDIKDEIQNIVGIDKDNQALLLGDKILKNNGIISDYNIKEGDNLLLLILI